MKITIAKALKEKNRLVGKINQIRNLISSENIRQFTVKIPDNGNYNPDKLVSDCNSKRKVDVAKLVDEWKELENKLIALKTAIQKANFGALDILVRLQEAKSHLAQIDQIRYGENQVYENSQNQVTVVTAVLGQEYQLAEKDAFTNLVNELQDKIDEYNATTFVEVAD